MSCAPAAFLPTSGFCMREPDKRRPCSQKHRVLPSLPRRATVATLYANPQRSTPSASRKSVDCTVSPEVLALKIREGIKAIAIGKDGEKPIPLEIIPAIRVELEMIEGIDPAHITLGSTELDLLLARASFMGSLFVKSALSEAEMSLLTMANKAIPPSANSAVRREHGMQCSAENVLRYITVLGSPEAEPLKEYALRLMNKERLTREEAEDIGIHLYTHQNNNVSTLPLKALIAHVMRIRHENASEIAGLARAAAATLNEDFRSDARGSTNGAPYALISEPFDGAITWDILTPLLARHLRAKYGLRTVMTASSSSGPKFGPNLKSVLEEMKVPFAKNSEELLHHSTDEFGAVVDQSDASPGLSGWRHLRQVILKRPAIATVEKYLDPAPGGATLFIGSAFHDAYIDKMAEAAEAVSFPCYVIVGKGMEGTTGLGLRFRRVAKFYYGWKDASGIYNRCMQQFCAKDAGVPFSRDEPAKGSGDALLTARRILDYASFSNSGDKVFDGRVVTTLRGFDKVMESLLPHIASLSQKADFRE